MFDYHIAFDSPGYLALLALLPVLWWWGYLTCSALGRSRAIAAIVLRTVVWVLFVAAVADTQIVRRSDRVTVIYLLDQSLSIPPEHRQSMIRYVNRAILRHRRDKDRVGVIVFGRDAAFEVPPYDDDVQMLPRVESELDRGHTDLARAMRLAQASFPEDAAKRIVIVSDGNENLGDAVDQGLGIAAAGIGIDVVAVRRQSRAEVTVERVALPTDVRKNEPFDLRVVVSNTAVATANDPGNVPGTLKITQRTRDREILISEEEVDLPPGKSVFAPHRLQITGSGLHEYTAEFSPLRTEDDATPQNNQAQAVTYIRGSGQVLLIHDGEETSAAFYKGFAGMLEELEVTCRSSDPAELFTRVQDLMPYDAVVLANVPREDFTDRQIDILVRYTQQMGGGLIMLGGPSSFGAGGWANTELEKAMPVDFQIQNTRIVPVGALVMLMHASEIDRGNHWQKVIAREALKALGPRDYCGVVHWNGTEQWLWDPGLRTVGEDRNQMLGRIDRMTPGDMPEFDPAMRMAEQGFRTVPDASVKHMIVISDGDPARPSQAAIQALKNLNVTVSTVAVGAHGSIERNVLYNLANDTGGTYYPVRDPKTLPKIFQREARKVAQPLVYEPGVEFSPRRTDFHDEMTSGIERTLPGIRGFVLTRRKENTLVETALVSPRPANERNNTILAGWRFGLGRSVALTTDTGQLWAATWPGWSNYAKLFDQTVRWAMRPPGDPDNFTVATDVADGRARVIVTALDKNSDFLNFREMTARVVGPDLKPFPLSMRQTAPGRYEGDFSALAAGSFFVTIDSGTDVSAEEGDAKTERTLIHTGISVPYSNEFRDRETNMPLLTALHQMEPEGAAMPGLLVDPPEDLPWIESVLEADIFRHTLPEVTSSRDAWHLMVLWGGCLFFFDVLVRRVAIGFAWAGPLMTRLGDFVLRRQPAPVPAEHIQRLRARKEELEEQRQHRQAGARFDLSDDLEGDLSALEEIDATETPRADTAKPTPTLTPEEEEETYTARLLRAKKDTWKHRGKD